MTLYVLDHLGETPVRLRPVQLSPVRLRPVQTLWSSSTAETRADVACTAETRADVMDSCTARTRAEATSTALTRADAMACLTEASAQGGFPSFIPSEKIPVNDVKMAGKGHFLEARYLPLVKSILADFCELLLSKAKLITLAWLFHSPGQRCKEGLIQEFPHQLQKRFTDVRYVNGHFFPHCQVPRDLRARTPGDCKLDNSIYTVTIVAILSAFGKESVAPMTRPPSKTTTMFPAPSSHSGISARASSEDEAASGEFGRVNVRRVKALKSSQDLKQLPSPSK